MSTHSVQQETENSVVFLLPKWRVRSLVRWAEGAIAATVMVAGMIISSAIFGEDLTDSQVKTVFVFNFANFVTWPAVAFNGPDDPINFCVAGQTPIRNLLPVVIKGERAGERALQFLVDAAGPELVGCHIVVVGHMDPRERRQMLGMLAQHAVLTVGEDEEFLQDGGSVALLRPGNRVRPMVNMDALNRAGLGLSAKLLRLATLYAPNSTKVGQ